MGDIMLEKLQQIRNELYKAIQSEDLISMNEVVDSLDNFMYKNQEKLKE
jgi:hypothetical protein